MEEVKKWKEFALVSFARKRDRDNNIDPTDHGTFKSAKKAMKEMELLKVAFPRRFFRIYRCVVVRMRSEKRIRDLQQNRNPRAQRLRERLAIRDYW